MKKITSLQNPLIKEVVALSQAKHRYAAHKFIAEGFRVCATLLQEKKELIQLYVVEDQLLKAHELCDPDGITVVDEAVMKKMSFSQTPSGILGVFRLPSAPHPENLSEGIVLFQINDPGNAGTLLRTCAAMGKKSAVFIEGVDPWHPKVIQASAGAIGSLHIFQWSWDELLRYKKTLKLCSLVVQGGKNPDEFDFSAILFVIGNEAHGIPSALVEQGDTVLTLEMPGNTESLNAAVAGSIALYLAWHKLKTQKL